MTETDTLAIQSFGIQPDTMADTTPAVRDALRAAKHAGHHKIVFAPGRYDFWPDRAAEHYLFTSNNDSGLKRIAFPLFGLDRFEIDGQGAEFVFHGQMVPFALRDSRTVLLHDFTIDWHQPFHCEAEILSATGPDAQNRATVDLKIPGQYPYIVSRNQLYLTDETGLKRRISHSLEFDAAKRETAYMVYDNYSHFDYHHAEELSPGTVRLTSEFGTIPTAGNVLVITDSHRDCPAVFVTDCAGLDVRDVTIHHAGAMGLIAQRTRDIHVERLRVTPPPDKNRCVSVTADATHFVNCAGLIEMIDCHFQGQMDDATNVHGIYARLSRILSPTEVEIEIVHSQQVGVHIAHPGDELEFVNNDSMQRYHVSRVTAADPVNKSFCRVQLESPLPPQAAPGDVAASLAGIPDLTIRGCTATKNRARGFLISTAGKVLIEDNTFHIPGCSILIAGDSNYWFESGPVRDVTIRGNHFDNCNFGVWGHGVVAFSPEVAPAHRSSVTYHSGVRIEGNTFDAFDLRLVTGHSVDEVVFRDNVIRRSTDYPAQPDPPSVVLLTDSQNVVVDAALPPLSPH